MWTHALFAGLVTLGLGLDLAADAAVPENAPAQAKKAAETYIKVEVRGVLHAGVMGVGGESTGYTISARGVTWELDFGKQRRLEEAAQKRNGRLATVTGTFEARPGVEVQERHIVTVTNLQ